MGTGFDSSRNCKCSVTIEEIDEDIAKLRKRED